MAVKPACRSVAAECLVAPPVSVVAVYSPTLRPMPPVRSGGTVGQVATVALEELGPTVAPMVLAALAAAVASFLDTGVMAALVAAAALVATLVASVAMAALVAAAAWVLAMVVTAVMAVAVGAAAKFAV